MSKDWYGLPDRDARFYREAGADSMDFPGDNARDRIIEKMARAMNIATDGHDRYWTGYVKSATAAHQVVADHLAATRPASQPNPLTDDLLVELFYAAQGDITKFRIKARAILESTK